MRLDHLGVLDSPLAYMQTAILTPEEFVNQCSTRGPVIATQDLEALHLSRTLFPAYRLALDVPALSKREREIGARPGSHFRDLYIDASVLREARDRGLLVDPRNELPKPWRTFRARVGRTSVPTSIFLYTETQLLATWSLRGLNQHVRVVPPKRRSRRSRRPPVPYDQLPRLPTFIEELIVPLAILSSYYRPRITGLWKTSTRGISLPGSYGKIGAFDPCEILSGLRLEPPRLHEIASELLTRAAIMDPIRHWVRLVSYVHPMHWDRLRGEALLPLDFRLTAETLLRFYDDLAKSGVALPIQAPHPEDPLADRLCPDRKGLESVLTEFGLSPFPAVILVLEGETEMSIVPRVMDLLGIQRGPGAIDLINAHGVDRDLESLISYAAELKLGELMPMGYRLRRPPTRFLIVFDPEGTAAMDEGRQRRRKVWIDRLCGALPKDDRMRQIRRSDIESLVQVDTWGDIFEFAHFSDDEIAAAINEAAIALKPVQSGRVQPNWISSIRASRKGRDVSTLWKQWPKPWPSKVQVNENLWPILEKRLRAAVRREDLEAIPIASFCRETHNIPDAPGFLAFFS